ncbi:MAG: glycosyltransferase family 4 protein [Saprospiraceae bacterium]
MIFHLSRYGYADYAAGLIDHLPIEDGLIYLSKYHSVPISKAFQTITTYRNGFEFLLSSLFLLPGFLRKIHREIRKQQVGVAYFPGFHYWDLPLIWVCKWGKVAVVYTVHDGILHEGENHWSHRWLQKASIRAADHLIFLTRYMREETLKSWKNAPPSSIIAHGPIQLPGLSTLHRHSPNLKLLFLGRIGQYKGIKLLLNALEVAENDIWEHLTIAGQPLYDFKKPDHPKINLIGRWLSEGEMVSLLHEHDLLILPYQSATQSGVVALGIAAAIPMICTKVGGLPEQLAENEAVWAAPNSTDILEAIRFLSKNPAAYDAIHQQLLKKRENVSWHPLAQKTASILSSYLSRQ